MTATIFPFPDLHRDTKDKPVWVREIFDISWRRTLAEITDPKPLLLLLITFFIFLSIAMGWIQ